MSSTDPPLSWTGDTAYTNSDSSAWYHHLGEPGKALGWKEWWVEHGVPPEILDVRSDFYEMLDAAVGYLTEGRCRYCGTLVHDAGRVNCKQCGAPLRRENA